MHDFALYNLHLAQRRADLAYRYGRPASVATDPRRELADSAEREAMIRLLLDGHAVEPTRAWGARYDLLCDGVLRVEVKAARWTPTTGGRGRYSCLYHNRADVLLWLCADVGQWFIIPTDALGDRRGLAIWSYDPADYSGLWRPYLGAWHILPDQVREASERGPIAHQGRLF